MIQLGVIRYPFFYTMKKILQLLSEKIQELKSNDELKLAALSGFTFGVLFVSVMYNIN